MCENCRRRWAQEDGRLPKDWFYYAGVGSEAIGTVLAGIVLSPFLVIMAVAAGVGWLLERVRR